MLRFALAAAAMACMAAPAHAQSDFWAGVTADAIGQAVGAQVAAQREARCMRGEIPQPTGRRMADLIEGANTTMARYVALAAASEASDLTTVYSRRRQRSWERISDSTKTGDVDAINDPLARTTGAALGAAETILLAGDGMTAAGLWIVRGGEGQALGHYRGVFRRERRAWRLLHLEVGDGADAPGLAAYCHSLGDVSATEDAASADAKPKPEAPAEPAEAQPSSQ